MYPKYPKIKSNFAFSATHEIVGKLQVSLRSIVDEINALAHSDAMQPHHFDASFLSISFVPLSMERDYLLRFVKYSIKHELHIQKSGGVEKQSNLLQTRAIIGPSSSDCLHMLPSELQKSDRSPLVQMYSDLQIGVRHEYQVQVRIHLRNANKKVESS